MDAAEAVVDEAVSLPGANVKRFCQFTHLKGGETRCQQEMELDRGERVR